MWVFHLHLLLNQALVDHALQRRPAFGYGNFGQPALIQEAFVAHNVIPFAGEDRMPIDDGDHAIEHLRR